MTTHLKLAAATTLLIFTGAAAPVRAQISSPQIKREKKPPKENVEWLWQYGPPPADGRENELVRDPHFIPFLQQYLTAPQTFWGDPKTGYKPLSETALDFLSVPDKVLADEHRYISITGCVFHFCPDRGLLWVDLGLPHPLVVFGAIDWVKENRTPSDPGATYTLWLFSNRALDPEHIPEALKHSITRWTTQPTLGSTIIQVITNVILVDPDGQPHPIQPQTVGANNMVHLPNTKEQP